MPLIMHILQCDLMTFWIAFSSRFYEILHDKQPRMVCFSINNINNDINNIINDINNIINDINNIEQLYNKPDGLLVNTFVGIFLSIFCHTSIPLRNLHNSTLLTRYYNELFPKNNIEGFLASDFWSCLPKDSKSGWILFLSCMFTHLHAMDSSNSPLV